MILSYTQKQVLLTWSILWLTAVSPIAYSEDTVNSLDSIGSSITQVGAGTYDALIGYQGGGLDESIFGRLTALESTTDQQPGVTAYVSELSKNQFNPYAELEQFKTEYDQFSTIINSVAPPSASVQYQKYEIPEYGAYQNMRELIQSTTGQLKKWAKTGAWSEGRSSPL